VIRSYVVPFDPEILRNPPPQALTGADHLQEGPPFEGPRLDRKAHPLGGIRQWATLLERSYEYRVLIATSTVANNRKGDRSPRFLLLFATAFPRVFGGTADVISIGGVVARDPAARGRTRISPPASEDTHGPRT
jgi:hypothetical protein